MNRKNRFLIFIPIGFLLLALARMPYGYYGIMRIVVSLAILIFAISECIADFGGKKHEGNGVWVFVLAGLVVLFNPLVPFRFSREIWTMIDLGGAVLLLIYYFSCFSVPEAMRQDKVNPTVVGNGAYSSLFADYRKGGSSDNGGVINSLEEHRKLLRKALGTAKSRVVIASPYLSMNAIAADSVETQIYEAAKRGVTVKVICNPSLGESSSGGASAFRKCVAFLRRSGAEVYHSKEHSKFIFVDNTWLVIGSFNWLSSVRDPSSRYFMNETSFLYSGEKASEMMSAWWKGAISNQRA